MSEKQAIPDRRQAARSGECWQLHFCANKEHCTSVPPKDEEGTLNQEVPYLTNFCHFQTLLGRKSDCGGAARRGDLAPGLSVPSSGRVFLIGPASLAAVNNLLPVE